MDPEVRRARDRAIKAAIPIEVKRAYNAKWRETVSEEWREAKRAYNRERLRRLKAADPDYHKRKRLANLETARRLDRERYERDKAKRVALASQGSRVRRARLSGCQTFRFHEADWQRVLRRHGHRCMYCGSTENLTRDHIIPIARGGDHSEGNIVPACDTCNKSKGPKLLIEWRSQQMRLAA